MSTRSVTIDLITERSADGAFVLVLVEEGPWLPEMVEAELKRLQERLYDAVDVVVDGHLARSYPDSFGRMALIRLDCYDIPNEPVQKFFAKFSASIAGSEEIARDLDSNKTVSAIDFELNCRSLNDDN